MGVATGSRSNCKGTPVNMFQRTSRLLPLCAFACTLLASTLWGCTPAKAVHPFHMSTAYIEVSKETGKLEIALKIHGDDLQVALAAIAGKKVSIDDSGAANPLIQQYMNQHFVIAESEKAVRQVDAKVPSKAKDKEKDTKPIQVIGTEFTKSWLWVFCEMEMPKDLGETAFVRNTILIDRVDSQINTMQFRNTKGRYAVRTSTAKPIVEIKPDWISKELAIPAGDKAQ